MNFPRNNLAIFIKGMNDQIIVMADGNAEWLC